MRVGIDALRDRPELVRGLRVGVVTNHTGLDANFRTTADVLVSLGAKVSALFGPEHGYDGTEQDALFIGDTTRQLEGSGSVPLYSLYRSDDDYGVPPGTLDGLDLLVFDMQDVGVRYYTYLSTLGIAMEAAAEVGLPVLVLDRPNPLGGSIEGPPLDSDCRSFVGMYDVPVRHGLTLGEAAHYINAHYLSGRVSLGVVPVDGWGRDLLFPATGLTWVQPSPNVPTFDTVVVYPGTCLFEGTTITEGRGTTRPFEVVGAPWIDADRFARSLNALELPGVRFRPTRFVPAFARYVDEVCGGVQVHPADTMTLRPVAMGLHMVMAARELYPEHMGWLVPPVPGGLYHFDRLIGSKQVRKDIESGASVADLTSGWSSSERDFAHKRAPCMLYQ